MTNPPNDTKRHQAYLAHQHKRDDTVVWDPLLPPLVRRTTDRIQTCLCPACVPALRSFHRKKMFETTHVIARHANRTR